MDLTLLHLRRKMEKLAEKELGVNLHGSGTNLLTGGTDFSFGLDGHTYSVCIRETTDPTENT